MLLWHATGTGGGTPTRDYGTAARQSCSGRLQTCMLSKSAGGAVQYVIGETNPTLHGVLFPLSHVFITYKLSAYHSFAHRSSLRYAFPGPDPFTGSEFTASAAIWIPGTSWCVVVDLAVQQFLDHLPMLLRSKWTDEDRPRRKMVGNGAAGMITVSLDKQEELNRTQCIRTFFGTERYECFWPTLSLNVMAAGVPQAAHGTCFPSSCNATTLIKVAQNSRGAIEPQVTVINGTSSCAGHARCEI